MFILNQDVSEAHVVKHHPLPDSFFTWRYFDKEDHRYRHFHDMLAKQTPGSIEHALCELLSAAPKGMTEHGILNYGLAGFLQAPFAYGPGDFEYKDLQDKKAEDYWIKDADYLISNQVRHPLLMLHRVQQIDVYPSSFNMQAVVREAMKLYPGDPMLPLVYCQTLKSPHSALKYVDQAEMLWKIAPVSYRAKLRAYRLRWQIIADCLFKEPSFEASKALSRSIPSADLDKAVDDEYMTGFDGSFLALFAGLILNKSVDNLLTLNPDDPALRMSKWLDMQEQKAIEQLEGLIGQGEHLPRSLLGSEKTHAAQSAILVAVCSQISSPRLKGLVVAYVALAARLQLKRIIAMLPSALNEWQDKLWAQILILISLLNSKPTSSNRQAFLNAARGVCLDRRGPLLLSRHLSLKPAITPAALPGYAPEMVTLVSVGGGETFNVIRKLYGSMAAATSEIQERSNAVEELLDILHTDQPCEDYYGYYKKLSDFRHGNNKHALAFTESWYRKHPSLTAGTMVAGELYKSRWDEGLVDFLFSNPDICDYILESGYFDQRYATAVRAIIDSIEEDGRVGLTRFSSYEVPSRLEEAKVIDIKTASEKDLILMVAFLRDFYSCLIGSIPSERWSRPWIQSMDDSIALLGRMLKSGTAYVVGGKVCDIRSEQINLALPSSIGISDIEAEIDQRRSASQDEFNKAVGQLLADHLKESLNLLLDEYDLQLPPDHTWPADFEDVCMSRPMEELLHLMALAARAAADDSVKNRYRVTTNVVWRRIWGYWAKSIRDGWNIKPYNISGYTLDSAVYAYLSAKKFRPTRCLDASGDASDSSDD